mmetsp:Transcript_176491/g.560683  ORF Transcript_176491/g.560683 Transcript_176491/m.560683 type:complete len:272 (+) Transcript_176491:141-956(+)
MAVRFRDTPCGSKVHFARSNLQVNLRHPEPGVIARDTSKFAFSAEPVKKFAGKGHWFELRVEDFSGASLNLLGIGFTSTDPGTLAPAYGEARRHHPPTSAAAIHRRPRRGTLARSASFMAKRTWLALRPQSPSATRPQQEHAVEPELPGVPDEIPKSYVAGYTRSCYWDGVRQEIEPMFKTVKPYTIFQIGVWATLAGCFEVYIDRRLALAFDPSLRGLEPINTEMPLWAFVDCAGGLRKATLLIDSVPPNPDEEGTPEPPGGGGEFGDFE